MSQRKNLLIYLMVILKDSNGKMANGSTLTKSSILNWLIKNSPKTPLFTMMPAMQMNNSWKRNQEKTSRKQKLISKSSLPKRMIRLRREAEINFRFCLRIQEFVFCYIIFFFAEDPLLSQVE